MTSNHPNNAPATPSRLDRLVQGRFSIKRYADLSTPQQLALACYLGNGGAWDCLHGTPRRASRDARCTALRLALRHYVSRYGEQRFGVANLPAGALKRSVLADKEIAADWPNWDAYHQWYLASGPVPSHPVRNRWPVILSTGHAETLQDGWHRLHCYVRQGARTVPALFFPQAHHLA